MFGTFTGNSRRPRNVNLSGQVGNPFANTSWRPSAASNATKAVSDAQAEREKRQAERQRLKAAGKIQRTWRGHRARVGIAESRRAAFDQLYETQEASETLQRLPLAFNLLLSFFDRKRNDDLRRVYLFVSDAETVDLDKIAPVQAHPSRMHRLTKILLEASCQLGGEKPSQQNPQAVELQKLVHLTTRIANRLPLAIRSSHDQYFTAMAIISQHQGGCGWPKILANSLTAALPAGGDDADTSMYKSLAFRFLANANISLFEDNIDAFARVIETRRLAQAILEGYGSEVVRDLSRDKLLWLLAHFIALGRAASNSTEDFLYLGALYTQVTALSLEISLRLSLQPGSDTADGSTESNLSMSLEPYITRHLMSLVDHDGIQRLLRDFSYNLANSSNQAFQGTSLLAGYILSLLQSFPTNADDTRMRLFLEQIPSASGDIPTVVFLWQIMSTTSIFRKLKSESAKPVDVLRSYFEGSGSASYNAVEEQEWRIVLLFLELYVFILRLSDDEDFFSGIFLQVIQDNTPISRIRSCSLSRQDVEALTVFLKNTAFALHYQARDITRNRRTPESTSNFSIIPNGPRKELSNYTSKSLVSSNGEVSGIPRKLDLDSLRATVTTTLKMLYERDSRKQFLPPGHWLMTDKLEQEDFVSAVVAEEERQAQEEAENSDDEDDGSDDGVSFFDAGVYSTHAGQRLSRHVRLERLRHRQVRAQKERRLAEMGPKLEILKHMPFIVPFETRVTLFRQFINLDRSRRGGDTPWFIGAFAKHQARIRRGQLFEDAYDQFYKIGDGLKDAISITFVDKFDNPEAGIDGGGVTKEFLTSVTTEAFEGTDSSGLRMFTLSDKNLLYPNPTIIDALRESIRNEGWTESDPESAHGITQHLRRFEFLGRVIGKCMYEGVLVDFAFAPFFLLKWSSTGATGESSYKGSVNDLRDMDEGLYNGMLRLKNYIGDVSDLGFDFTINDQVSGPDDERVKTVTRKLVAHGDDVAVTNDNRLLYISYVARHRLVVQPHLQTAAFLRGLHAIIRPSWLSMFNQSELQRLVGGDSSEIDIDDLRDNTIYGGLYEVGDDGEEHQTIKMFWKVMAGFTDAQRRDVVKYVSSTPRAPLLGFSQLRPKFSIRDGGTDQSRLPSTSTCVNLLKLPRYTSEATLREKLLYAVTSGAGFDLS